MSGAVDNGCRGDAHGSRCNTFSRFAVDVDESSYRGLAATLLGVESEKERLTLALASEVVNRQVAERDCVAAQDGHKAAVAATAKAVSEMSRAVSEATAVAKSTATAEAEDMLAAARNDVLEMRCKLRVTEALLAEERDAHETTKQQQLQWQKPHQRQSQQQPQPQQQQPHRTCHEEPHRHRQDLNMSQYLNEPMSPSPVAARSNSFDALSKYQTAMRVQLDALKDEQTQLAQLSSPVGITPGSRQAGVALHRPAGRADGVRYFGRPGQAGPAVAEVALMAAVAASLARKARFGEEICGVAAADYDERPISSEGVGGGEGVHQVRYKLTGSSWETGGRGAGVQGEQTVGGGGRDYTHAEVHHDMKPVGSARAVRGDGGRLGQTGCGGMGNEQVGGSDRGVDKHNDTRTGSGQGGTGVEGETFMELARRLGYQGSPLPASPAPAAPALASALRVDDMGISPPVHCP
jgi:hypothetical protein